MAFRGGSSWSGGYQNQSGEEQPAASSTVEVPYTYSRTDDATPPHPVTNAHRRAGAGLLHGVLIACSIVPHAFILSEASEWYGNADSSLWRPDGGKWRLRNDRWQPPWQKKNTAPRGSKPITQDPGPDHGAVPFRVVQNATAAQNQNCAATGMNSPGGVFYDMAAVAAAGLVPYAWWDSPVRGPLQQLADSYVANFPRYERPSGSAPEQSPSGAASSGGQSPAGAASGGELGVDSTRNWERAAGATVRQFPRGGDVATLKLENMLFSGSEEYSMGPGSSGPVAVGGAPDVVVEVPAAMDTEEGRDGEAAGEAPLSIPSTPDQTGRYSAWGRPEPAYAQQLPANQAQPGQEACFAPVQQGNPTLQDRGS
eukprot:g13948.t1